MPRRKLFMSPVDLSEIESLDADEEEDDDGFFDGDLSIANPLVSFSFCKEAEEENVKRSAETAVPHPETTFPPPATPLPLPETLSTQTNKPLAGNIFEVLEYKTLPDGSTPPINGEYFSIKRCHKYRPSTLRKLTELKLRHPALNAYMNTIIDEAICYYYQHICIENGEFHTEKPTTS